ncbi:MAG TPA: hypothetical protein VFJ17_08070 [Mycobacteriales bacterium]|jgi:hypothetical protein|nr:hypothetical protein [Mycobacteriales bacterium]
MRTIARVTVLAAVTAATVSAALPAFAGQAWQAPGFPSGDASCVGAAMNFQAHYGGENDSYPTITHGTVGPTMSGHATTDGPGAVGDFESTLAQSSGPIWVCLP